MAENKLQCVENECSLPKKQKMEETDQDTLPRDNSDDVDKLLKNLPNFELKRILRNDTSNKRIAIEGVFEGYNDNTALIVLEKKIFPEDHQLLQQGFFNNDTTVEKLYRNDIYSGYDWFPVKEQNGLNVNIIYPATKKHIEKWTPPEYYLIEETPELYKNVTLPKLLREQFSLQWVDNILDGSAEKERVVYNDENEETGFVLVKDLKWDDQPQTLYLLAIARKRIGSIRDLNESHLPLLKNIRENGCKAIEERYNIPSSQLKIFFHYQPSFYHLHVHFTSFAVENAGAIIERGHFLTTVINNIELVPDYYQRAIIPFRVPKYSSYEPYKIYLEEKDSDQQES